MVYEKDGNVIFCVAASIPTNVTLIFTHNKSLAGLGTGQGELFPCIIIHYIDYDILKE